MPSFMPELLNQLDVGVGIFSLDDLRLIECNQTLTDWLELHEGNNSLAQHITQEDLVRLQKSILKGRVFRFKKYASNKSRIDNIDFKSNIITLSDQNNYLMIQGVIDNSERKNNRIMKDYSLLNESNKQLLKQEKEKAQAANNAKSMFIATMSHELRTPMNGILGMAQKMESGPLDPSQVRFVKAIRSSGAQLLAIINEILDFSKIESQKLELHVEPCNLNNLVTDIVEICSCGLDIKKGVIINLKVTQPSLPIVLADDVRLKQVFLNLLSNAIKFTEQGSVELAVELLSEDEINCQFSFVVTDTGIGMEQEKIDHLFEAFTQHDASTTRHYGGTGLGLTICNELVKLMQGTIIVKSELGKGSEFKVLLTLPLASQNEIEVNVSNEIIKENNPLVSGERQSIMGKKILVAEDTLINQEVIKMALEDSQVDILMADNGQQAVELFKNNPVDIILMDCLMPIMDGFQAVQEIRKLESNNQRVPIVGITASISDDIIKRCKDSGMNDVMHKPFDFDELVDKVTLWVHK